MKKDKKWNLTWFEITIFLVGILAMFSHHLGFIINSNKVYGLSLILFSYVSWRLRIIEDEKEKK